VSGPCPSQGVGGRDRSRCTVHTLPQGQRHVPRCAESRRSTHRLTASGPLARRQHADGATAERNRVSSSPCPENFRERARVRPEHPRPGQDKTMECLVVCLGEVAEARPQGKACVGRWMRRWRRRSRLRSLRGRRLGLRSEPGHARIWPGGARPMPGCRSSSASVRPRR